MSANTTPQDFPMLETTRPNGYNINHIKIPISCYSETREILRSIINVCGMALNCEWCDSKDNKDIYNLLKLAEEFIPQEEEYNILNALHIEAYKNQENTPKNGKS